MLVLDQLKRSDPHLRTLSIGVLIGMAVLIVGLWYVQIVSYQRYERSLVTQSSRTVRLPGVRGKILDRNHVVLAENRPSYNVNLYLEDLRQSFQTEYTQLKAREGKPQNYAEVASMGRRARYAVVSNLVNQVSGVVRVPLELRDKDFQKHYDERIWLPMPVMNNLSHDQVARFAETASGLAGVSLEAQPLRVYPHQSTAAHLLGHLMPHDSNEEGEEEMRFDYRLPDFRGLVGVEATFDEELRGNWGAKSMLVNNLLYRQSERVIEEPQPGDNVVLTIDVPVQKAAENALHRRANLQAAAVVLDVRTGDILAMASEPTFDPNAWVPRISATEYAKLNDQELTPMMNRASFGVYQPGSIFKILIALAALEAGTLRPEEVYHSPYPYYQLKDGRKIEDTAGAGDFDFKKAFYRSSNSYFIHHGLRIGVDRILEMGERFCLGEKSGLPTRQDAAGYFPEPGTRQKNLGGPWLEGDTANLSIGQGEITVTPLQMAVMVAAIANGGKVLWPRLVDRVEPSDPYSGKLVRQFPSAQVRSELNVKARNLQIIRDAMLADVEHPNATGVKAHVPGFRVCGKTGTAEVKRGRTLDYKTTWFASFGPYENPRYAVVVMVDRARSGGDSCAPIAREIYEALVAMEKRPQNPNTTFARMN